MICLTPSTFLMKEAKIMSTPCPMPNSRSDFSFSETATFIPFSMSSRRVSGADGADNAGEAHLVGGGVHVQRARALDVGVAGAGPLLPRRHIELLQDGVGLVGCRLGHDDW